MAKKTAVELKGLILECNDFEQYAALSLLEPMEGIRGQCYIDFSIIILAL